MASALYIFSVKANGSLYYIGQKLQGATIHYIEPASISVDRPLMHEFVIMSNKHILASLRNYTDSNHHIEYKLGSARIISFEFAGTPYKIGQFVNGLPITEIGHYKENKVPDTKVYLKNAAMETIRSMEGCDNIEIWYKPYTSNISF